MGPTILGGSGDSVENPGEGVLLLLLPIVILASSGTGEPGGAKKPLLFFSKYRLYCSARFGDPNAAGLFSAGIPAKIFEMEGVLAMTLPGKRVIFFPFTFSFYTVTLY
jgi:hypothetical protein